MPDLTSQLSTFLTNLYAGTLAMTSMGIGGTTTTAAGVNLSGTKTVTALADAAATTVLTITIPNAEHAALIKVKAVGISGAGGSIGEGESAIGIEFLVAVARTAGVNAAVAGASAAESTGAATVTGGNGLTIARGFGAVTGAVGATNTCAVQITVSRAAGTATNHIALVTWDVLNFKASGVTVA